MPQHNTPKTRRQSNDRQIEGYSPIILRDSPSASSNRNLTGLPRFISDLVAQLYNSIQKWNDLIIKGTAPVKQIATMRNTHSPVLEELLKNLDDIVQQLRDIRDTMVNFSTQMESTAELHKDDIVFISLNLAKLSQHVNIISEAYEKEFEVKQDVLERIGFSKNQSQAVNFANLWVQQRNITKSVTLKIEVLLVETGHRGFS